MYGSHTLVRRINSFSYCISFHGTTEEIVGVKKLKTTAILIVFGIKLRFKCLQNVICWKLINTFTAAKLPNCQVILESQNNVVSDTQGFLYVRIIDTTYTHIKIRTFETEVNEKIRLLHRLENHVNACFSYHSFSMFLRDS